MATVLQLEFPWGRYHATPWGRNVNEGLPEWPPSPWRVLRALFASWKARCPNLSADDVEAALSLLAGAPAIRVPMMKPAHLRHFMPQIGHRSIGKPKTTLTFDSFAAVCPDAPIFIEWDVDMAPSARKALEEMAAGISYLGRSESICNVTLVHRVGDCTSVLWRPAREDDPTDVEILCASEPLHFRDLIQSPDSVRRSGRLFPPGSRLVGYRKTDSTDSITVSETWRPTYSAVRFAVQPRPRPTISNAVVVAELLRRATLKKHAVPSEVLSGKEPSGLRSRLNHQHAHYMALPRGDRSDAGAPIDALLVWAPGRLMGDELAALAQVKWLRPGQAAKGIPDLAVALAAFGEIDEVAPEIVGPSPCWESRTPFAPSRHASRSSWSDHVRSEIERELSVYRGLPTPVSVDVLDKDVQRYRRYRLPPKETMGSRRRSAMVRIKFDRPVEGPIVLGSLSHFGLGLFLPTSGDS